MKPRSVSKLTDERNTLSTPHNVIHIKLNFDYLNITYVQLFNHRCSSINLLPNILKTYLINLLLHTLKTNLLSKWLQASIEKLFVNLGL